MTPRKGRVQHLENPCRCGHGKMLHWLDFDLFFGRLGRSACQRKKCGCLLYQAEEGT